MTRNLSLLMQEQCNEANSHFGRIARTCAGIIANEDYEGVIQEEAVTLFNGAIDQMVNITSANLALNGIEIRATELSEKKRTSVYSTSSGEEW